MVEDAGKLKTTWIVRISRIDVLEKEKIISRCKTVSKIYYFNFATKSDFPFPKR
jgi:hypothetical protein